MASPNRARPEYTVWLKMRERCNNPRGTNWKNYGGRGIRVCPQWDSFEQFLADVGPRPSLQHTLNRRDNDGHYEPGNVHWATNTEQARNTRRNHELTAFGETKLIVEWLEDARCAVNGNTLRGRIRRGFDPEWAIAAPPTDTAANLGDFRSSGAANPFSRLRDGKTRRAHPNERKASRGAGGPYLHRNGAQ